MILEGVVIRFVILSLALTMLTAGTGMAQEQKRPDWVRFAKSEARLPRSAMRSDLPIATAYIASDGRVEVLPAERVEDLTGSIGAVQSRHCNALQDMKPEELRRLGGKIAGDEGVPADLVTSILRIEQQTRAGTTSSGIVRLTSGPTSGNADCLPAVTLRAGIRRLKDLSARYSDRMHLLGAYHAGEDAILASGGVPTAPETLRFVAEVMNDLAGGLAPQSSRRSIPTPRRIAGAELMPRPSAPSLSSRAAGDPRWASGFVLNLE